MSQEKKKPIIIPVETKSREFHGKLFLALHLLKEGYPILFGNQARLWDYCDLIEPSVYLDKSVAATRVNWFEKCKLMGHKVVSWDEEGLVFFNAWMFRKLRIDPNAFEKIDKFFAWGAVQKSAICEKFPEYDNKISVCGNPRFDFLRDDLRIFYQPKVKELKERFGKMLLVNTNFAFYNHFKKQGELQQMLAHYPLADEPGYIEGWIQMHKVAHYAFLEMVPELLSKYPEHTVVVRPHPSENHKPWQDLAKKFSKLHVDSTGNVHEWILASEAVIHFNCTTAVESYLLGVMPIAYRPEKFPLYENSLPNSLSVNVFSLDELLASLAQRNKKEYFQQVWSEDRFDIIKNNIISQTGENAAERITREMVKIADSESFKGLNILKKIENFVKRNWRIILHIYRDFRTPPDGYTDQKFPGIGAREIENELDRMMEISNVKVDFHIHYFCKNCYWLIPRH